MRSNLTPLMAGLVAAFFYVSVFLHMGTGQLLWPLAAVPLYMVVLGREPSDNLLALAGAGLLISLLSVLGVLGPGSGVKTLGGFAGLVAGPAILSGLFYKTLGAHSDPVRGEPLLALLILLSLTAFFISALIFMLTGTPLHTVFSDVAAPLAENMHEQFQNMNTPQAGYSVENLTWAITLQMAAFVPLIFTLIHGVCLLVSRRFLVSLTQKPLPAVKLSPLRFPLVISFLFFAALAVYVITANQMPGTPLGVYLGPVLMGLALPLAAQGLSTVYEKLLKTLSLMPRYGVYMVLIITLTVAPIFLGMVFILVGMLNQVVTRKTEIK